MIDVHIHEFLISEFQCRLKNIPVCAGSSVVIRLDLKETRSLVEQQRFSAVASVHYCRYEGANSGNISGNFCQSGFCPTI